MRTEFLSYCQPSIGEEEISEVVDSLRAGWVTTGPKVQRFEDSFAEYVGARHALAVNSWTGGYHIALRALGIGPGDEVILPTMTFCSAGNMITHLGARPVLVDTDENLLMSVSALRRAITPRTRAIVPVHYGGQACELDEILDVAGRHGIPVVEDGAHAAGTEYGGRKIGTHGSLSVFSFYATKNITTGEGGMVTTNDDALAGRMRLLRLHGMSRDAWKRYTEAGSWFYEVLEPGYKYNMTDLQAAMGIHQLRKLDGFTRRRQQIARRFAEAFAGLPQLQLPRELPNRNHTYHLYPVLLDLARLRIDRGQFIEALKAARIGASVHFIPLHRHPFYQQEWGFRPEQFPVAESVYQRLVSLPLYPKMTDEDVEDVVSAVRSLVLEHRA